MWRKAILREVSIRIPLSFQITRISVLRSRLTPSEIRLQICLRSLSPILCHFSWSSLMKVINALSWCARNPPAETNKLQGNCKGNLRGPHSWSTRPRALQSVWDAWWAWDRASVTKIAWATLFNSNSAALSQWNLWETSWKYPADQKRCRRMVQSRFVNGICKSKNNKEANVW